MRGLAQQAGLAPSTISRLERDIQRPRPATLAAIASALGVPAEWLTGEEAA